jgi:hypothetical protein
VQSAWRPLPEHIELMPQDQDFSFQPPSRLEAVAQRTDEEEGNRNHQLQSCSDSAAAVTPADDVFGSDSLGRINSAKSEIAAGAAQQQTDSAIYRQLTGRRPKAKWHRALSDR